MLPDFNRLRVFFHVHRAGSASAAAAELHVTQSAVSQGLAKLEQELGAQLFVRRHRKLVPTAAAAQLYGIVAPFVESLDAGLAAMHRAQHELTGTIRIGAPVEFGAHRLPAALASFRAANPGVAFELVLGPPSRLLPRLDDGRLDLAFVDVFEASPAEHRGGLEVVDVLEEQLVLVASRAYERRVLAGSRTLGSVAAASFVEYQPAAPAVRSWFHHHFGRVPPRLDLALVVESVQAVIAAVRLGMGLGVVPSHTIAAELQSGALVVVGTRRRTITSRVSLVRVLDRVPSRAEKALVRALHRDMGSAAGRA